jgi:hypothetical protein
MYYKYFYKFLLRQNTKCQNTFINIIITKKHLKYKVFNKTIVIFLCNI